MLSDPRTGRSLVTTAQAADEFGCSTANIRRLGSLGRLREWRLSPRVVFYDLEEVRLLAASNRQLRKQRGGRPTSKAAKPKR